MAKYVLGRKQRSTHEDWLDVLANIEQYVSKAEIDTLIERTAADIRKVIGSGDGVAFAWSGGKDSQAVRFVMESNGIATQCLLGMCNLEYPAFLQWATDNMPADLEIVNTGQDLNWLAAHPEMLFPQNATIAAKWFHMVQHTAQERYFKKYNLRMLIMGRRRLEGNYVGENGVYTTSKGITRFSPVRDWQHEDILALVYYYKLPLPPFYGWPRGFRVGSGAWPARQWCNGIQDGWREIAIIDRSIVEQAAPFIDSAYEFLCAASSGS